MNKIYKNAFWDATKISYGFKYLFFISCMFMAGSVWGQTTLISPTGDGGFENGSTFAANGWTAINGGLTWYFASSNLTNGSYSFARTGNRSLYISSSTTANNWAGGSGTTTANTSHFYRDIIFPSGNALNNLSFRWCAGGEASYDELLVYLCPTSLTPSSGSPSLTSTSPTWTGTGTATLLGRYNFSATTGQTTTIAIPQSVIGNQSSSSTMRLVFTWKNDGTAGTAPGLAIDDISLTSASCTSNPLSGTYSIGPSGNYASLTAAIADINNRGISGNIFLELNSTYTSTGETFPIILGANGCMSSSNTITIRPASGATGRSITSTNTTATIDINGGNWWIIDGRPGGVGSTDLTISNTSSTTGGVPIRFINDASNNTVQFCTVSGGFGSTTLGTIFFSTGVSTGNDNNTVNNCNINSNATAFNGIFSSGTSSSIENNSITISNNNIYNFFNAGGADWAILISSGNSGWTISGNSLYQTVTRTMTTGATDGGISISNSSGNNFTIANNFIGGTAASCGGTAWTIGGSVANRFRAISLSVGTTIASSIQGNTIANFNFSTSSGAATVGGPWCGIYMNAGNANIGTNIGNTIGSATGTGSIVSTSSSTSGISSGIFVETTTGTVAISNNTIGSINTVGAASVTHGFTGISTAAVSNLTVSNNTIGSTTTSNSINASFANTNAAISVVTGIRNSATGVVNIKNNTIANLNSASTPSSNTGNIITGITSSAGTDTISGNTIRNLTCAGIATGTGASAGVIGISMTSSTASALVTQNNIFNLSNTNTTANALTIVGLLYTGATSGTNIVSRNNIYGLSVAGSTAAVNQITGINMTAGTTTVQNNMIALGNSVSSGYGISGILEASVCTNNHYHNTVYIGGSSVSGATNTFAFNSAVTTNTRAFQNNIFINARSNGAGTGKHYAVSLAGTAANPPGLTSNYNIFRATGTGGVFGLFNSADRADLTAWQTATGQDANSKNADPCLANPSAATPDLHLTDCSTAGSPADAAGINIASVIDDFGGQTRSSFSPVDIGADAGNYGPAGVDASISALTSPTATSCHSATENVTVTLVNASTSSLDFSANNATVTVNVSGAVTQSLTTTINSGILAAGASQSVTVGTLNTTTNGTYTFASSVSVAGDVNTSNNSISPNLLLKTLSGTLTIGATGQSYTTLTAASTGLFADINTYGLSGNTVVNIVDASVSETGAVALNQIAATCGGTPTLTIKPQTTATLTGSVASGALIKFNGADNVTIDGSNSGGTDKSLTITNTATTAPTTIAIISLGAGAGASNNTIKNCNISTGVQTSTGYGISVGGTTPGTTGADNDNITITNNNINASVVGIYSQGTAITSNGGNDNLNISSNTITYNGALASNVGININNSLNSIVNSNNISITSTATSGTSFAMQLAGTTGATVSQNTISVSTAASTAPVGISLETNFLNSTVTRNTITQVFASNTGGYGGRGITIGTGSASSNITIANNFIAGVNGTNWSSYGSSSSAGIWIGVVGSSSTLTTTTGGVNIYHNTVNMTGSMGSASSTALTSALYVGSGSSTLDIRNNIFANTQTATSSSQKNYAIYSAASNSAFSNINYNNYFVSNSFNTSSAILGFLSSDQTTLSALTTAFGGNANSINFNPVFISSTDLHANTSSNCNLAAGQYISSVSTDIDGDTRSNTLPDIGADEFTPTLPTITLGSPLACVGATSTSLTYSATTGSPNQYSLDFNAAAEAAGFTDIAYTTLPSSPLTVSIPANTPVGTYTASMLVRNTTSGCISNSYTVNVDVVALPTISVPATSICSNSSGTLTASGASTYAWSPATGLSATTGTSVTINPTTTTTYTITGTDGNGCQNTTTAVVTVNTVVAITTQPSNQVVLPNANANFTVASTGTGLTYQWEESTDNGNTWSPITNGGVYSGATTNSLLLTSVNSSYNNYQYRVVINGTAPCNAETSNAATLTLSNTAIVLQPQNQTICSSTGTTTFTISTSGTLPSYQWQTSTDNGITWIDISGENDTFLSLSSLTISNSQHQYRCQLDFGAINSNAAILTVYDPPLIGTQPSNLTVCSNTTTGSFSVSASGSNLTYQWQVSTDAGSSWNNVSGSNVSGATSASLSFSSYTNAMNGNQYRVVVSGSSPCTSVTSNVVTLNVTGISVSASASTVCQNSPVTYTVTPTSGSPSLSYSWTSSTGSGANTAVTANPASITPTASGSYTYTLATTGGGCTFSNTASLTVNPIPNITKATATPTTICSGEALTLTGESIPSSAGSSTSSGAGTGFTSPTGYPTFFGNYWYQDWSQILYTASELTSMGLVSGNITALRINVGALPSPTTINGYSIRLGSTSNTSVSGFQTSGLTTVFNPGNYTVASTGNVTVNFSTPYFWDGISGIIVDIRGTGQYASANATINATSTVQNTVASAYTSSNNTNFWTSSPAPTLSKLRPNIVFNGQVGTNQTSNFSWSWNSSPALFAATGTITETNNGASATTKTYTVTATNASTGCSNTATTSAVTINPATIAPTATNSSQCGSATPTCSVSGTGTASNTFRWYTAATGGTAIAGQTAATLSSYPVSTTSSFYVSESNGTCESPRTQVDVTVSTPPTITVAASVNPVCSGSATSLSASSANTGYTYAWSNGLGSGANVSASPTANTTYTVTATDNSGGANNGCATTGSILVTTNPVPSALTLSPSTTTGVCGGSSQTLSLTSGGTMPQNNVVLLSTSSTISIGTNGQIFRTGAPSNTTQAIYSASELLAMGLKAGDNITAVSYETTVAGSPINLSTLNISTAWVTDSFFTNTTFVTGLTSQSTNSNVSTSPSVKKFSLSVPPVWNGSSHLLIQAVTSTTSASSSATERALPIKSNTTLSSTSSTLTGTLNSQRPYIMLDFNSVQPITWSPTTDLYTDAATTTAYTGTAATTLYAKPTANRTYTATATIASTGCTNTKTVQLNNRIPANNVVLASSTKTGAIEQCTDVNGWTYYGTAANPDEWLFGIFKNGNNFTATVDITVDNVNKFRKSASSNGANQEHASYIMSRSWNVNATGTVGSGVKVRFFIDPQDITDLLDERDDDYDVLKNTTNPSTFAVKSGFEWFKTVSSTYSPTNWNGNTHNGTIVKLIEDTVGTLNGQTYVELSGITSFSGGSGGAAFGPTSNGLFNNGGVVGLPVTWHKVDVNTLENGNEVVWSTSSEQNTSHFEVEYSEDAVQFYKVSENIPAAGNSSTTQYYKFLHESEMKPWLYYRVKQVDLDGKVDYSKIIIAKRATKLPDFKVHIYPIPLIEGDLNLDIHSIAQTELQIRIIDLLGKEVHREKVPSKGYRTQHQLQLNHLPKGQYQIQIENSIFSHQQRLVLMK